MAGTEKNNLREQVAMLPQSPGVYQFVDRSGTIIYVGTAYGTSGYIAHCH